jgi:hypothetical protein
VLNKYITSIKKKLDSMLYFIYIVFFCAYLLIVLFLSLSTEERKISIKIPLEDLFIEQDQLAIEVMADFSCLPYSNHRQEINPDTANLSAHSPPREITISFFDGILPD